jgi:hypothetical protein
MSPRDRPCDASNKRTALIWWPLAPALAGVYFALAYRMAVVPARDRRA